MSCARFLNIVLLVLLHASDGRGYAALRKLEFLEPKDCTTIRSDHEIEIKVVFEHDLPVGECVIVNLRHSSQKVWWFMTPPTPLRDKQHRFCVGPDFQLSGSIDLPVGYVRLSAWWDQTPDSIERLPRQAVAYLAVLQHFESHDELLSLAWQGAEERKSHHVDDVHKSMELSHKYRVYAKHKELQSSTIYTPGLIQPRLIEALRDGSPAALWRVITEAGSPLKQVGCEQNASDGIWQRCSTPGFNLLGSHDQHSLPWWRPKLSELPVSPPTVYRIPVFSPDLGEMLLQELEHANTSPLAGELSQPQNPEGHGRRPGSPPGAVMMAEIGLGTLADSLIRDVLAPIGRLIYPQWGSDSLDQWWGFSIHSRTPTDAQQIHAFVKDFLDKTPLQKAGVEAKRYGMDTTEFDAALNRSHPKEALYDVIVETIRAKGWAGAHFDAQLQRVAEGKNQGHNDICELSINICLGRNFSRNGVWFTGWGGLHQGHVEPLWVPHIPGTAYISVCQHQHGVAGPAEGERHSLVVRAMSSQIRAAPAEGFAMRCLASQATSRAD